MNSQNDSQYIRHYVQRAVQDTHLGPPDQSRANELYDALDAIFHIHKRNGPKTIASILPMLYQQVPKLNEIMNPPDPVWKFYSPSEFISSRPAARYCDKDKIIQAGELTAVVSQPGIGKSFWVVAKSSELAANGVKTLIVAAEGLNPDRLIAMNKYREREKLSAVDDYLQITDQPLDLTNEFAVDGFVQFAMSFHPRVIFFDTFAACNPGRDENTVKDMQPIMNRIREQIISRLNCAVVLLHHTTKDGKGFRGSNAIRGSITNMYLMTEDDGQIILKSDKQRDAEASPDREYELVKFETRLHPETGEQLCSAVMLPGAKCIRDPKISLSKNQRIVLEALDGFTKGVRYAALVDTTGLAKSSLMSALKTLIKAGRVSQSEQGEPYVITQQGTEALGNG